MVFDLAPYRPIKIRGGVFMKKKLGTEAKIWGTEDFYGFGFLNYIFEGLVTGDKYGSAVGIVAFILVIGGAFGIIMRTGSVDSGIHSFIKVVRGYEFVALPALFVLFSLGGAVFGIPSSFSS